MKKILIAVMILCSEICLGQHNDLGVTNIVYNGETLRLLHPTVNVSYDSIRFNKNHDTAFLFKKRSNFIIIDGEHKYTAVRFFKNKKIVYEYISKNGFWLKTHLERINFEGHSFHYDSLNVSQL